MNNDTSLAGVANIIPVPGELADMVRRFDWAGTPLGPIQTWPQSLRSAVNFVLGSQTAIVMLWGEEGVMIYNDAYSQFAGKRLPSCSAVMCAKAGPRSPTSMTM